MHCRPFSRRDVGVSRLWQCLPLVARIEACCRRQSEGPEVRKPNSEVRRKAEARNPNQAFRSQVTDLPAGRVIRVTGVGRSTHERFPRNRQPRCVERKSKVPVTFATLSASIYHGWSLRTATRLGGGTRPGRGVSTA